MKKLNLPFDDVELGSFTGEHPTAQVMDDAPPSQTPSSSSTPTLIPAIRPFNGSNEIITSPITQQKNQQERARNSRGSELSNIPRSSAVSFASLWNNTKTPYTDAFIEQKKWIHAGKYLPLARIAILGDDEKRNFLIKQFPLEDSNTSATGDDGFITPILEIRNSCFIPLQVWDMSSERIKIISDYSRYQFIIFVFDMEKNDSFAAIDHFYQRVVLSCQASKPIYILVGIHSDQFCTPELKLNGAKEYAAKKNMSYWEISSAPRKDTTKFLNYISEKIFEKQSQQENKSQQPNTPKQSGRNNVGHSGENNHGCRYWKY